MTVVNSAVSLSPGMQGDKWEQVQPAESPRTGDSDDAVEVGSAQTPPTSPQRLLPHTAVLGWSSLPPLSLHADLAHGAPAMISLTLAPAACSSTGSWVYLGVPAWDCTAP